LADHFVFGAAGFCRPNSLVNAKAALIKGGRRGRIINRAD
jgi:hypothetical protein